MGKTTRVISTGNGKCRVVGGKINAPHLPHASENTYLSLREENLKVTYSSSLLKKFLRFDCVAHPFWHHFLWTKHNRWKTVEIVASSLAPDAMVYWPEEHFPGTSGTETKCLPVLSCSLWLPSPNIQVTRNKRLLHLTAEFSSSQNSDGFLLDWVTITCFTNPNNTKI